MLLRTRRDDRLHTILEDRLTHHINLTLHNGLFQAVVEIRDGDGFADIVLTLSEKLVSNTDGGRCRRI